MLRIDPLPGEQEALEVRDGDRLNLRAETVDREPMNAREQPPLAPFQVGRSRMKLAAQNESFTFQGKQGGLDFWLGQMVELRESSRGGRADYFHAPAHQFPHGLVVFPLAFPLELRGGQRRFGRDARIDRLQHRQPLRRDPKRIPRRQSPGAPLGHQLIDPRPASIRPRCAGFPHR